MKTSAPLATTAVAIAVLAITTSCSRASAVSRPITDFIEDEYYHSFATPGGQIQCRVRDESLACQFEGDGYSLTVTDSALCGFYPGLEQGHTRRFGFFGDRPQPCATIIQGVGYDSPHTLDYGQSVTAPLPGRTVTCTSAVDGLTCTSADGAGSRAFHLTVNRSRSSDACPGGNLQIRQISPSETPATVGFVVPRGGASLHGARLSVEEAADAHPQSPTWL